MASQELEAIRAKIARMVGAGLDWEGIAEVIGFPEDVCRDIYDKSSSISIKGDDTVEAAPEHAEASAMQVEDSWIPETQEETEPPPRVPSSPLLDRETFPPQRVPSAPPVQGQRVASGAFGTVIEQKLANRMSLVIMVHSHTLTRTGKTTLCYELASLWASSGGKNTKVALVDGDIIGKGLFLLTAPEDTPMGLRAWKYFLKDAEQAGWSLPGQRNVTVWAMETAVTEGGDDAWADNFWLWARSNYGVIIIDTGEVMPGWVSRVRPFVDEEIIVVPQDLISLVRIGTAMATAQRHPKESMVVMGYNPDLERMNPEFGPRNLSRRLNLPLRSVVPHDPQFANWMISHHVPWFPSQAKRSPELAKAVEAIIPEIWRGGSDRPAPRRGLFGR